MSDACTHLDEIDEAAEPSSTGCEDCLRTGDRWMHLRMCRVCGHIGCCDSSPNKHATAHNAASGHPLVSSYEPGEEWWWCYADEVSFELAGVPSYAHP
jgi:hypothetical protein